MQEFGDMLARSVQNTIQRCGGRSTFACECFSLFCLCIHMRVCMRVVSTLLRETTYSCLLCVRAHRRLFFDPCTTRFAIVLNRKKTPLFALQLYPLCADVAHYIWFMGVCKPWTFLSAAITQQALLKRSSTMTIWTSLAAARY